MRKVRLMVRFRSNVKNEMNCCEHFFREDAFGSKERILLTYNSLQYISKQLSTGIIIFFVVPSKVFEQTTHTHTSQQTNEYTEYTFVFARFSPSLSTFNDWVVVFWFSLASFANDRFSHLTLLYSYLISFVHSLSPSFFLSVHFFSLSLSYS